MRTRTSRRPPVTALAMTVLVPALALAACSDAGSSATGGSSSTVTAPATTSAPASASSGVAADSLSAADQALLTAATDGDLRAVRTALAAGGRVTATDGTGATALVRAAYGNHVDVAAVLVEAGGDVNHQDGTQQSAYLIATSEVGPDPALLDLTLAHGADVDAKDSYNGTGLIRAAHRGYADIVDRLLAAGIDRDHVNRLGWTALLEAVILGDGGPDHQKVVESLVGAGVDRSVRDKGGRTALDHARESGYDEIVRLLS